MHSIILLLVSTLLAAASPVVHPHSNRLARRQDGPVAPDTASDCTWYDTALSETYTCAFFEEEWGITREQFVDYNPTVGKDCSGIIIGNSYCVEVNFGLPRPTSKPPAEPTTTKESSASTTSTKGPTGPSPTQAGLAANCNKFYLAQSGDNCQAIVDQYGTFTLDQFYDWNPAVGSSCGGLWAGYYYCVGIPGVPTSRPTSTAKTTTTKAATTTKTGNGITTPTPTQSGIVSSCDRFHLVKSGDSCANIAAEYSISVEQFVKWNPAVGSDCTGLWANYHACVRTVDYSPPKSTTTKTSAKTTATTTTSGNGITTPTPTQPGMIKDCNMFRQVQSGDTCASIGASNTVLAKRISDWNTSVGSSCEGLWAGYYVCTQKIGFTRPYKEVCHTKSDYRTWGGYKNDVKDMVSSWCSNSGTGSGVYAVSQTRTKCITAASGKNKVEFVIRNEFGARASMSNAKCVNLLNFSIDRCARGAEGSQEGWFVSSRMIAGTC